MKPLEASENVAGMKLRRVYVEITPELILELLKIDPSDKTCEFVEDAIPQTARAIRAGVNPRGDIALVIEDESFDEVAAGCVMPQLSPMYRRIE